MIAAWIYIFPDFGLDTGLLGLWSSRKLSSRTFVFPDSCLDAGLLGLWSSREWSSRTSVFPDSCLDSGLLGLWSSRERSLTEESLACAEDGVARKWHLELGLGTVSCRGESCLCRGRCCKEMASRTRTRTRKWHLALESLACAEDGVARKWHLGLVLGNDVLRWLAWAALPGFSQAWCSPAVPTMAPNIFRWGRERKAGMSPFLQCSGYVGRKRGRGHLIYRGRCNFLVTRDLLVVGL